MSSSLPAGTILLIDKPYTWTSFDVVRYLTSRVKVKAGHAGTLDPLATGLLIVCTNKFTKRIDAIQQMPKAYTGTIVLGASRIGFDKEHPVDELFDVSTITENAIMEAAKSFVGTIEQMPPKYSAKKINGVAAYELMRSDKEVELKKSIVSIYSFDIKSIRRVEMSAETATGYDIRLKRSVPDADRIKPVSEEILGNFPFPVIELDFEITCSKGTYIRSIANDFGEKLAIGGHLSSLRRTKIGEYNVEDALSPEGIIKALQTLPAK